MGNYGLDGIGIPVTLFSFAVVVFVLLAVVIRTDGAAAG
jgi:hypothetical protein